MVVWKESNNWKVIKCCCKGSVYFIVIRIFSRLFGGEGVFQSLIELAVFTGLICWYVSSECKKTGKTLTDFYIQPWTFSIGIIFIFLLKQAIVIFAFSGTSGTWIWSNLTATEICSIFLPAVIDSCLGSAINEEIVFRGVLFGQTKEYWGVKGAVLFPTLLFAFGHLLNETYTFSEGLFKVLITGSIGVLCAYVTISTKSIWTSVFIHSLNNLTSKIISTTTNLETYYTDYFDRRSLFICVTEPTQFEQWEHAQTVISVFHLIMVWLTILAIWGLQKYRRTQKLADLQFPQYKG